MKMASSILYQNISCSGDSADIGVIKAQRRRYKELRGLSDGLPIEDIPIDDLSEEEETLYKIDLWNAIRLKRNELLTASDWMLTEDNKLTAEQKETAKGYRQLLKDIPQDYEDPELVEWPSCPDFTEDI